ncbi:MAG: hypothetical protein J0L92_41580 [Deltaproteobacteria bacterium]|nr:hypothetical protein [Deltaproteobacteria bacterium]
MSVRPAGGPEERDDEDVEGEASDLALDDAVSLPALDGEAAGESAPEDEVVEPSEDENVGLDDAMAEEAAEAEIDTIADLESEGWETSEDDDVDADDELAPGESESWREGSEEDTSTPLDLDDSSDDESSGDAGEEGLEDDVGELELPPRPPETGDEAYPDELELG